MQNEKDWFCERINECSRGMYSLAYGILKNSEDAQDAIQDAICKAYEHLDSLRFHEKFKPWIMKIVTSCSYEILRRKKDTADIDCCWNIQSQENVDIGTKLSLWDAVQSLGVSYRTVIVLYYYEGFSVKEIAGITKISPDTVKKQLSRGREMLRRLLSEGL